MDEIADGGDFYTDHMLNTCGICVVSMLQKSMDMSHQYGHSDETKQSGHDKIHGISSKVQRTKRM